MKRSFFFCIGFFLTVFLFQPLFAVVEREEKPKESLQEDFLRALFVKRLRSATAALRMVHEKRLFSLMCDGAGAKEGPFFDRDVIFESEEIDACRQKIEEQQSLQPFFDLWDQIEKKVNDVELLFLREVTLMVLLIYKAIYTACSPLLQIALQKNDMFLRRNFVLQAVTPLFENLSSLHMLELLNMIEKLTIQIPDLLERFELSKSKLTWWQWIKKYWWLIPVGGVVVTVEAVFLYQVATGKFPQLEKVMSLFLKENKESYGTA